MDISDQELFDGALSEDVADQGGVQAEASVTEAGEAAAQHRDEQGRFAATQTEQADTQAEGQQPGAAEQSAEEAHVPSWRMRELREERDAAVRRSQEIEAHFQRQIAELRTRLPQQEPPPIPSVFEDEQGFLQHGVKRAIDPIQAKIADLEHKSRERDEYLSRQFATQTYGPEKVSSAEQWIRDGYARGDQDVLSVYQRAFSTFDPIGEIVRAHQQRSVYQQIGSDPNAWFEKQLEERMKDPAFAGAVLGRIQQGAGGQASGSSKPNVRLPPSLSRIAAAAPPQGQEGDVSDADLFESTTRARR